MVELNNLFVLFMNHLILFRIITFSIELKNFFAILVIWYFIYGGYNEPGSANLWKIPSLSAGQRKVAEYILNNKDEFSYATLAKLSKDISVSETTVIRFAYSLGFDSFSAMQQKLREEILSVPQRNVEGQIQNQTFYQKVFPEKRRHCKTGSHI